VPPVKRGGRQSDRRHHLEARPFEHGRCLIDGRARGDDIVDQDDTGSHPGKARSHAPLGIARTRCDVEPALVGLAREADSARSGRTPARRISSSGTR